MSSLDMSLDDIAKAKRQQRGGGSSRGGRGGNRQNNGNSGPIRNKNRHTGNQQRTPYQRPPQQFVAAPLQYAAPLNLATYAPQQPVAAPEPQQPVQRIQGDTIHVSNLAPDVNDADVREIFVRIGHVKSANVNYNAAGKSTGTATVVFARKNDAEKAVQDYDEAEVDGRVMKLKLIGTVVTAPVVVKKVKPQVVPAAQPQLYIPQTAFQQPLQFQQSYAQRPQKQQQQAQQRPASAKPARGGRGGAAPSRGGRGGATRGGRPARPAAEKGPKSQEDLDRELDSYHSAAEKKSVDPASAGQPTSA